MKKSKTVIYIFLFLWLTVSYNSQFVETVMPFTGFSINVLLEAVLIALLTPTVLRTRLNIYQKWVLIILVFWAISVTWSVSPDAKDLYFFVLITYLSVFCVSKIISTKRDVEKVLMLEIIAVFLCGVYVLLFVNTGNLADERLGGEESDRIWNANDIGLKMAVGYASCVYFLVKKGMRKSLLSGLVLFFVTICMMSGSRKVIFLLVVFTSLLMIIHSNGRKKLLYGALAILFAVVVYLAIMNISPLYDMIGRRFELLLAGIHGGDGGGSLALRAAMIEYGIVFWEENPWLGNGFNAFSEMYGVITGWFTYSHNNFLELLTNSGIVGCVLYYSLIFYVLKKLWKPAFYYKDSLAQVLFLYTLISFVLDYAMISYLHVPTVFRLMYTSSYSQIVNKKYLEDCQRISPSC